MMTIWKYPIPIQDVVRIEMPFGAKILSVQEQAGTVCLWCLVDTLDKTVVWNFRIYGTGHEIDREPGDFIGTVQTHGGSLVWHIFEA